MPAVKLPRTEKERALASADVESGFRAVKTAQETLTRVERICAGKYRNFNKSPAIRARAFADVWRSIIGLILSLVDAKGV